MQLLRFKRWKPLKPGSQMICLCVLGIFYILLFQSYRAYEIDNPWFLSFSRNFWTEQYGRDFFQNGVFPDGMGGTVVFGRLAALCQGTVLSAFAWQPVPAMLFSTAVVLAGLYVWATFLRRSGYSEAESSALIVAMGVSEPFVGMAERFRYEPFSFLFLAISFWLVRAKRPGLALITGLLAFETEPAGAIMAISVFLFLFRSGYCLRALIKRSLLASLCFAAIYTLLHPDIVQVVRHTDWHRGSGGKQFGGFVSAYFFNRKRHLPECVLFLATAYVYIRQRDSAPQIVHRMAQITALVCAFSFIMSWPTPAYMIFFLPFALAVAAWVISRIARPAWNSPWLLPILISMFMLPQYAALAWINRNAGYREADLRLVSMAISRDEQRLGLDDAKTEIMGDYSLWFAHPARYRAISTRTQGLIATEDLFLCFDGPLQPPAMNDPTVRYCDLIRSQLPVHEVDKLTVRDHVLHILVPGLNHVSRPIAARE